MSLTIGRIIRTLPPTDTNIWDSSSPFMLLIRELDTFYESLPDRLQITELNTYIHKDQHTIGALFYLHLMYNAAIFDLTRISLAGFSFPLAAAFQNAPPEFRSQCQERCRFHAAAVSDIVRQGLTHGRVAFDDNFCADAALESSKVQIIHSTTVANDDQSTEKTRQNLRTTLQLFDLVHANQDGQSTYVSLHCLSKNPNTHTLDRYGHCCLCVFSLASVTLQRNGETLKRMCNYTTAKLLD